MSNVLLSRFLRTTVLLLLTVSLTSFVTGRVYSTELVIGEGVGPAQMSVFSNAYGSSNVTDASLTPGSLVSFEINIANAPAFNGFEFFLYYDSRTINVTTTDVQTGTVFPNPFIALRTVLDGNLRLAVVNLGSSFGGGSGTLVHISFKVLGVGVSPLTLSAGMNLPSFTAQSWSRIVLGTSPIDTATSDGYFKNVIGRAGPSADFSTTPPAPLMGETVLFDATASFDIDNYTIPNLGIGRFDWDFGDGHGISSRFPLIQHMYAQASNGLFPFTGNFSVRLTVFDEDDRFIGIKTSRVEISSTPLPTDRFDVITASDLPLQLSQGDTEERLLSLVAIGSFIGSVSLTASPAPSIVNGTTVSLNETSLTLTPGGARPFRLKVTAAVNTFPGLYVAIITGNSGLLTSRALVFIEVVRSTQPPPPPPPPPPVPLQPLLVRGKIQWSHHLSLTARNGVQTWTAKVSNSNPDTDLKVNIDITGFTDSGTFSFRADSGYVTIRGGEPSLSIDTTHLFGSSDIGVTFTFTAIITWIYSPVVPPLTSSSTKSGSFTVAA